MEQEANNQQPDIVMQDIDSKDTLLTQVGSDVISSETENTTKTEFSADEKDDSIAEDFEKDELHNDLEPGHDNRKSIWEKLQKQTSKLYITEYGECYWPEKRQETEQIAEKFLERRILFVKSIDEDWLDRSIQRLSAVLFAGDHLRDLIIRKANINEQLKFGFWQNEQQLHCPVVVVISVNKDEFYKKFLDQHRDEAQQFIHELKKLNLYIVCQIKETENNKELFIKTRAWIYDIYAFWDLPVLKLHLVQEFKLDGLNLFNEFQKTGKNNTVEDLILILDQIRDKNYEEVLDIFNNLKEFIEESISDTARKKNELISLMEGDEFITQVVIFCASFFNDIYYPDFYCLINDLLKNEAQDTHVVATDPTLPNISAPVKLDELWRKNAMIYMKRAMLKTEKGNGNQKVKFVNSNLASKTSEYFINAQYPLFYRIYKKFDEAAYLTKLDLSERLEVAVIRFFSLAAGLDTSTHNAVWLKNLVCLIWRRYTENIPKSKKYTEWITYINRQEFFKRLIIDRIPLIISELFVSSNEIYKEIIKNFFRLLLDEKDTKIIAVILASRLYNELRFTKTLSNADFKIELMSYIRRAIEEGEWEDSFFAYNILRDNFLYNELWIETNLWIEDDSISMDSWTKRFAYLYQIDYILATFDQYFRKFNGEKGYELWPELSGSTFPDSFTGLFKKLFSEPSLKSLRIILEDSANVYKFKQKVKQLERVEYGQIWYVSERFEEPYNTVASLLADVLEIWFYILSRKTAALSLDPIVEESWNAYFKLICETIDAKTLREINTYWSAKIGFYSLIMKEIPLKKNPLNNKQELYCKQLPLRRTCLRILTIQLHHFRSNIL